MAGQPLGGGGDKENQGAVIWGWAMGLGAWGLGLEAGEPLFIIKFWFYNGKV